MDRLIGFFEQLRSEIDNIILSLNGLHPSQETAQECENFLQDQIIFMTIEKLKQDLKQVQY